MFENKHFVIEMSGPEKGRMCNTQLSSLFAAGVFGDSLGTFADGVLGKLTR